MIELEIVGLKELPCGPFPCNDERSCELEECAPTEKLLPAVSALEKALQKEFTEYPVSVTLTLLDDGIPSDIREIIDRLQPPLPIVLLNGKVTPVGRISLQLIRKEIEKEIREKA